MTIPRRPWRFLWVAAAAVVALATWRVVAFQELRIRVVSDDITDTVSP